MPRVYSARRYCSTAYGDLSLMMTVDASAFFVPAKSMIGASATPAEVGALGSATRLSVEMTSSGVTSLPLWKVTPWRSLTVQVIASADGSTDSARAGAIRYW